MADTPSIREKRYSPFPMGKVRMRESTFEVMSDRIKFVERMTVRSTVQKIIIEKNTTMRYLSKDKGFQTGRL